MARRKHAAWTMDDGDPPCTMGMAAAAAGGGGNSVARGAAGPRTPRVAEVGAFSGQERLAFAAGGCGSTGGLSSIVGAGGGCCVLDGGAWLGAVLRRSIAWWRRLAARRPAAACGSDRVGSGWWSGSLVGGWAGCER